MHLNNCFITLTYDDEHLPKDGSLQKPDLQKFFKRLRKRGYKFRYYACGEYGDRTQRAHYHAILFGLDFPDKQQLRQIGEHTLYTSKLLRDIWTHGNVSIGNVSFETAAYTARYIMKKQTGKGLAGCVKLDETTGELTRLVQPFAVMSLKPAIGRNWFVKYHRDIYNADKDYIVMRGKKLKPAKYYDKLYDLYGNDHYTHIKSKRIREAKNLTDSELNARARIARARIINRTQV